MSKPIPPEAEWLRPGEVALLFKCTAKTINWYSRPWGDRAAIFHPELTPGGHRRYRRAEVEQVHRDLNGGQLGRPIGGRA